MSRTKEILGFSLDDTSYDLALNELLEISKGLLGDGTVIYRPYYVAATYILTYTPEQKLEEADGVVFRNPREIYENLMMMQGTIDASLGLILLPGLSVNTQKTPRNRSYGIVSAPTKNSWNLQ